VPLKYNDDKSPFVHLPIALNTHHWYAEDGLPISLSTIHSVPSPDGLLLGHCGGPGLAAHCGLDVALSFSATDNGKRTFDIFGVTQRGVSEDTAWNQPVAGGRWYSPDSPVLSCYLPFQGRGGLRVLPRTLPGGTVVPPAGFNATSPLKLSDLTTCDCDLPVPGDDVEDDINPMSRVAVPNDVEKGLRFKESVFRNCYNSPKWTLLGVNNTHYNFLDHVGTTNLAHDLERLRQAVGSPYISIAGMSYGTNVGATYAAVYPQHVYRLLLNGNVPTEPTTFDMGWGGAQGSREATKRLLNICSQKAYQGHSCNLGRSPEATVDAMLRKVRNGEFKATDQYLNTFTMTQDMIFLTAFHELGDSTGKKWIEFMQLLVLLCSEEPAQRNRGIVWVLQQRCVGFDLKPGINECIALQGDPEQGMQLNAIRGVDYQGRHSSYDAMIWYENLRANFQDWYAFVGMFLTYGPALWPGLPSPCPMGMRQDVQALVVGNLADPATPYSNSVRMRAKFPDSSLLTWQGVGHCTIVQGEIYDPEGIAYCQGLMKKYMGGEHILDGEVCYETKPVPIQGRALQQVKNEL